MRKNLMVIPLFVATAAYAQVTVPNTFTSGDPISSSEMNANFSALVSGVNARVVSVGAFNPLYITGSATTPLLNLRLASTLTVNGSNELALASGAITSAALGTSSVTSSAILDGSIMNNDVNASAAIGWAKISKAGATAAEVGALGIGEVGNTANKIVRLDALAKLPAVDGSQLTNLPTPWLENASGVYTQAPGNVGINSSASSSSILKVIGDLTGTAGVEYGIFLSPTLNQMSGAGYSLFGANVNVVAQGSGAQKLVDLKVGGAPRFTVMHSGDVGIGTSAAPTTPLQIDKIVSGVQPFALLRNTNSPMSGNGAALQFQLSSLPLGAIDGRAESGSAGALVFHTSTSSTLSERMRITSSGSVGIGTIAPAYRLDVLGDVQATSFITASDVRLKKNVRELPSALAKLRQIRGVSYDWKNADRAQREGAQIGVIAQEVEAMYPSAVRTDSRGMKSVSYATLVAPLINAVKELDRENRMLKDYLCKQDPAAPFCP